MFLISKNLDQVHIIGKKYWGIRNMQEKLENLFCSQGSNLGLEQTSRPVLDVRKISSVRMSGFQIFSLPDSRHLTLLKFKIPYIIGAW